MLGGGNNKGLMSVVYGAIVFAITIVFIVQFRPNSGQKAGSIKQECVARVRDRCITPKEFLAELGLMAPRGMDEKRLARIHIRRQVMDGLVERALLNQDAERLGISISDAEINRQLARGRFHVSLPVAHENLSRWLGLNGYVRMIPVTSRKTKKFSYKTYKRMVRLYTNRSPVEFKEMQRRELIADRMRKLIRSRASITEREAFEAYKLERSSAKLDYVRFHARFFLHRYVDMSDKKVEKWAEEHSKEVDEMWKKRSSQYPVGCRRARHILVMLKSATAPNGHPREEAQKIIEQARERLAKGEPFDLVAQELSEDHVSAQRGGDLGCFGKGKMAKPFEEAVFGAKKVGLIDNVVETPYGLHLIDVTLITSEDAAKAEKQAKFDLARDMMASKQVEEMIQKVADQVREATTKGTKLQEAVDQAMSKLDKEYGVGQDKKDEGKDEKEQAESKERPQGYPTVETTGTFTRQDSTPMDDIQPDEDVVSMAFELSKPGEVAKKLIRTTDGFAIIALRDKHEATRREFKKDRDQYMENMRALKGHDLLVHYVHRLREKAKASIEISERWAQEPKRNEKE